MPTTRELIGYGIGALGVIFGAWAAFEAQGRVGALSALSAGCASLAGVWGWSNKPAVVVAPKQ